MYRQTDELIRVGLGNLRFLQVKYIMRRQEDPIYNSHRNKYLDIATMARYEAAVVIGVE